MIVDRLALADEDLAVDTKQIRALHALFAGHRTHEESPIDILETDGEVGGLHDLGEEWKGAVVELHSNALEGIHAGLDLNEVQSDGLVGSKHLAGSDTEK